MGFYRTVEDSVAGGALWIFFDAGKCLDWTSLFLHVWLNGSFQQLQKILNVEAALDDPRT